MLEGYVKRPAQGLCELIWNAFDEDAELVKVVLTTSDLGGLDQISVEDDGNGMTLQRAETAFATVGDSWKHRPGALTDGKRPVHGRLGRGRYAAFGLARSVTWISTASKVDGGDLATVRIVGSLDDLQHMEISEGAAESDRPGTTVILGLVTEKAQASFDRREDLRSHLLSEFALHLERFADFKIDFAGEVLDPSQVIEDHEEIPLELPADLSGAASLVVIQWTLPNVERRLYLCTSDGSIVDEIAPRIQSPGAEFTAYLKWDGFTHESTLLLADDTESPAGQVLTIAKAALRTKLAESARKREAETVQRWRNEGVYPFDDADPPEDSVAGATREVFNVVAMTTARAIEETKSQKVKALTLRLLKETLENDPESLVPILREVIKLPAPRLEELKQILERTTLTQLIQIGKQIGERVEFINSLDTLIFGRKGKKRLLERRQLHRILTHETWIFGEEWSLTGDDEALNRVLKKFLQKLGQDVELATAPIRREDGSLAIPDLVMGRAMPQREDRMTQLVVELKRPSHKLDSNDVTQIRSYASAIVNDERFDQPNITWDFWLVGNETRREVDEMREQTHLPYGCVHSSSGYRIWVFTWAEIISSARHRIKFVQDSLQYESTHDTGLEYLRDRYADYLPDDLELDEDANDTAAS